MLSVARIITRRTYEGRVLRVLTHIQRHLDGSMCLEDLARLAHFSPFHFHRVFRGLVGETIGEHVRRLRLERAARRLRRTTDSVLGIALDAGYDSHEAFTRAFRSAYDMSPTEFRRAKEGCVQIELDSPAHVHYKPDAVAITFIPLQGESMIDVRIETIEAKKVAYMRGHGPYQQMFPVLWKKFSEYVNRKGLGGRDNWMLSICWDDPKSVDPDKIRGDACITVDESVQPDGEAQVQIIPAGTYAVARYKGPYSGLGDAWGELCGRWIPNNGYKVRNAPCFEVYRNTPMDVPESELITEIYEPVHPKS